ncbi:Golgi CORVET complex core vacuolar protein 8-domain-containing protein [Sporodiniella umbellata]|nr:Golgi CORVET complex core vacuolar protein 8-domain-containing protein [Sporodiniella umbellata]
MESNESNLPIPEMKPSLSVNTTKFRRDYATLLKEVLEESSEDEEDLLNQIDIDLDTATAELPEDLRAALEDRSLADKYLANLKTFMSHRRSQSVNSITSGKGEYSLPNTPLQASFNLSLSPKPFERADPLSKVLDAVPYRTRLISGVPSLSLLEKRFHDLIIPELDLPVVSDTIIQTGLSGLYKIRDDLFIHLNGGPLVNNPNTISEKKKQKVIYLLDDVSKEIGLYEEFIKKAKYLTLENILNESDSSDDEGCLADSDNCSLNPELLSGASTPRLPHFLANSPRRGISQVSTNTTDTLDGSFASSDFVINEMPAEPYEAFKWTPLVKISDQLRSDAIKQEGGLISVMTVSGVIAIGTTRGLVFVYDYSQSLKCILGDSSKAIEIGSVTSLSISSDHTTIACGHSQGYIVLWDIQKPAQPLRTIEPIPINQIAPQQQIAPRKEGHVHGASILHLGFVGVKRSEIVSADNQGMSFYHTCYKMVMINGVDSTRILGRYQNLSIVTDKSQPAKARKPSTVFAMQPLSLGQIAHQAENFGLIALLTPYKMIVVGLKPAPQTLYKFLKPKTAENEEIESPANIEYLSGSLSWLPVLKTNQGFPSDPILAFAWGNHLFILRVCVASHIHNKTDKKKRTNNTKRAPGLDFIKVGEWKNKEPIVGIKWINKQILVLFTPNDEMILFDPKNMVETQRVSIQTKHLVYHDWFNSPLNELTTDITKSNTDPQTLKVLKSIEMAYFGSINGYKGKLFLLGLDKIYMGTLLSWADRILALFKTGDYLECIELATSFYNGINIQTVIGLPEDESARKDVVSGRLIELLKASLKYAFSSERSCNIVGGNLGEEVSTCDLAKSCIEACLSMGNYEFLFETVYECFVENQANGIFLEELEPFIIQDRLSKVPPIVMKDLVDHYSRKRLLDELEQVIWHVNPRSLDIDQVVSMCHREGMYEAMMYVWNKSMHDYVSPLVEMLKVIRSLLRSDSDSRQLFHTRANAEKLFDYLRLVLTGKSFPEGSSISDADEASEIRSAVYSFVFSGRCVVWPPVCGKLILTVDDDEEVLEPTYPYLRLLLRFNTKKFLEALEIAFEDPWLNGGEDILSSKFEDEVPGKVISRQIIVNTLLDVISGGLSGNNLPPPRPKQSISASTVQSFTANHRPTPVPLQMNISAVDNNTSCFTNDSVNLLCIFIASNLHNYTTFILLPPKTLGKVLEHLAEDHDPDTRILREKAVQNLLTVYTPTNEEHVVQLYEEAGFWKVLEDVYRRDRKYGKLVEAYLKDDERRETVFECVRELLTGTLTDRQKEEVMRVFMIRISQFVEISGQSAAEIVQEFGHQNHEDAIHRLEEDQEFDDEDGNHATADKCLFSYLRGLLEPYSEEDPEHEGFVKKIPEVHGKIQERYIDLMCRFDPSGVFSYFNTNFSNDIALEKVKESCEKYGVMDALVWIMEKSGNTQGALQKMLEVAKERSADILQVIKEHQNDSIWTFDEHSIINSCLIGLNGVLRVSTRLCENSSKNSSIISNVYNQEIPDESDEYSKNSGCLPAASHRETYLNDEVETLWFRLLDTYVEASIEIYSILGGNTVPKDINQRISFSFKTFVQSILTSLLLSTSPQVSLPRLLLRLIDSQSRGETTFADFRDIFLNMLDTYKYEGKLLEMTNRLFDRDLFSSMQDMVSKQRKGWRPSRAVCELCGESIFDLSLLQPSIAWDLENSKEPNNKKYIVFHCGHSFHLDCSQRQFDKLEECSVCYHGCPKAPAAVQKDKGKEKLM